MSWIKKAELLSFLFLLLIGTGVCGNEKKIPTTVLSHEEIIRNTKIEKLKEEREKLLMTMHHTRIRLIRKDSRLLALQREIIRRSRELALELNATREMEKLNDSLAKLDKAIEDLANDKKKTGDKK